MTHRFRPLSRADAIAVPCPTCGAEPTEPCRRGSGATHKIRQDAARAALTRHRTALRDARRRKGDEKDKRVALDFYQP
jgi:hypothetical protein